MSEDFRTRARLVPKGNRYEDFEPGRVFKHHWGRTITESESTLFSTLTLHFNPHYFNAAYARAHGHPGIVVNPLLVFTTVFGLTVARAFARAADGELSRGSAGAIVGAVDGIVFLGITGTLVGAFLASCGRADSALVAPAAAAVLALVGSAVLFGLLAYGMIRVGIRSVAAVFVAGTLGAAGGAYLHGPRGLFLGAVGGLFVGTTFGLLSQR